jgi:hypothetical protein
VRPEGLGKLKKSPHRVSNPRPSGLQHSALTTILPPYSLINLIYYYLMLNFECNLFNFCGCILKTDYNFNNAPTTFGQSSIEIRNWSTRTLKVLIPLF